MIRGRIDDPSPLELSTGATERRGGAGELVSRETSPGGEAVDEDGVTAADRSPEEADAASSRQDSSAPDEVEERPADRARLVADDDDDEDDLDDDDLDEDEEYEDDDEEEEYDDEEEEGYDEDDDEDDEDDDEDEDDEDHDDDEDFEDDVDDLEDEAVDPSLDEVTDAASLERLNEGAATGSERPESDRGADEEGAASETDAAELDGAASGDEARDLDPSRIDDDPAPPLPTPEEAAAALREAADADAEEEELPALTSEELQGAVEALLFSTGEPVTVRQMAELFEVSVHDVREAVEAVRSDLEDTQRAVELVEVGGGVQLLTLPRYHAWVARFHKKTSAQRLSKAALETLAVIAYKQPLSKAALEGIRGVQCSPILKTLLDRGLVKIVGREDSLGKPLLYGTTQAFLEGFGLASLKNLPQPEVERSGEGEAEV